MAQTATAPVAAPRAAGATSTVDIKVLRFNTDTDREPTYQTFQVEVEPTDRVLDALNMIKWYQDGSLTYRRSCAHGVCGSDAMRIDGVNRLACKVLLKDLDPSKPIIVEPIKGLPVEKDLIVDMEPFFQSYREIMPFLVADDHVSGLVVDAMKRTMRLPTDPVDFGIEPLLCVLWLETILEMRSAGRHGSTWAEVASLHPAVLIDDDGPFDDLVERCELVAASYDWESVRTSVMAGQAPFGLEPRWDDAIEWASWFDAGSFARALLAERLPLRHLANQLAIEMEPELFHRVFTTVEPFSEALR